MKIFIKMFGIILLGIAMFNLSIYVFNIIDAWLGIFLGITSLFIFIFISYSVLKK
jgi:hypothetical protein